MFVSSGHSELLYFISCYKAKERNVNYVSYMTKMLISIISKD